MYGVTNRKYIAKAQIKFKLTNLTECLFRGEEEISVVLFCFSKKTHHVGDSERTQKAHKYKHRAIE